MVQDGQPVPADSVLGILHVFHDDFDFEPVNAAVARNNTVSPATVVTADHGTESQAAVAGSTGASPVAASPSDDPNSRQKKWQAGRLQQQANQDLKKSSGLNTFSWIS